MQIPLNDIVQYFLPLQKITATPINNGLINKTFKIESEGNSEAFILQQINTNIFAQPALLQQNYQYIAAQLLKSHSRFQVPAMVTLLRGGSFLNAGKHGCWRMFTYIKGSYAPAQVNAAEQSHEVALSFSRFTLDLADAEAAKVQVVIPRFHDVAFRHQQLVQAIEQNKAGRIGSAKKITTALERYQPLLAFYNKLADTPKKFRQYIQHHDAKISNILFDERTNQVITPIDLDTTMPGYFFSDAGDMIRSMATNTDENSTQFDEIDIRSQHYEAIADGYLSNMGKVFTKEEQQYFHLSGLLLTYMQCLRFITDYLNGDIYYSTSNAEQNLQRASNQLALLQALEAYVKDNFRLVL
jgi:aminoglycoside phosphotransferase (APT) family kinase protein